MQKKFLHIFMLLTAFSLFLLLPIQADAASYKLVRTGTRMQCINESTETAVTSRFLTYKGHRYYFGADGYAHTGWLKYGKDYYFFNANGYMLKKQWVGSYYLRQNGKMAINRWITPTQYVGSNGKLIPGYTKKAKAKFVKDSKGTKYLNYSGTYSKKTWQSIKGKWYYFYSTGYMAKSRQIGNYYVNKKGQMVTNKKVRIGKYYYHYGADGCFTKKTKIKK